MNDPRSSQLDDAGTFRSKASPQNSTMGDDILADLKMWLGRLQQDGGHRVGALPGFEVCYVRRAIDEIDRLRQAAKGYGPFECL